MDKKLWFIYNRKTFEKHLFGDGKLNKSLLIHELRIDPKAQSMIPFNLEAMTLNCNDSYLPLQREKTEDFYRLKEGSAFMFGDFN